ncbi:MAG TPA: hypothetical protein DEQ47_09705 [Solibacterales bacterium]|nr:hypothetical protein [Bryobacterales bacterium]
MAEDAVVVLKEQLTDEMVEAGAQLTQKLLDIGVPISVAMWFFVPETNRWRLLFSSPQDSKGPRVVYEKIQQAREALGPDAERLPFTAIGLKPTSDRLIKLLQREVPTGTGLSRVRLSGNAIDGHYIDDALIYRSAG